jgi:hypothetical protein
LTRELRPSALRPEQVIAACVAHFAAPLPR